jgi:hypothetical protein
MMNSTNQKLKFQKKINLYDINLKKSRKEVIFHVPKIVVN